MNDLLADSSFDNASKESDIEMGITRSQSHSGMDTFNKQIHEIEKQVDKLSGSLTILKDANEESKIVTRASAMKAIRKRMERDINEVRKIARNVKAQIEAINKENLAHRQKPGCGKGTSVDRSRTNMTNALTKKFRDVMTEFQTLRQRIDSEYREVVARRVIAVTGTRPDEETINNLIETGKCEQIYENAILGTGCGQVLSTLEEIQERHDTVKEIERMLRDLHQIYLDMAVMVEAQQEMLDNIEIQVSIAVDHVQSGTNALQTAKKLQKSSRKWMCFCYIALIIIVALLVIPLLLEYIKYLRSHEFH